MPLHVPSLNKYESLPLITSQPATVGREHKRRALRAASLVFAFCVAASIASPAQKFVSLAAFNGTDGARPGGSLVQGFDGSLYGTTAYGGTNSAGTVFKIGLQGHLLTSLFSFCPQSNCVDGAGPNPGLVQGRDGNLYGTSGYGGAFGYGNTFKMTPRGTPTNLYSFCTQTNCSDGAHPNTLIQAANGTFYGTTTLNPYHDDGTVFKLAGNGSLTTLHRFAIGGPTNRDIEGVLIQGRDGNFYGTTPDGGLYGMGTVYKITSGGLLTTLYSFCAQTNCTDGATPAAALVEGSDGDFYGITSGGGTGRIDASTSGGTVFKITAQGSLTTLHSFCTTSTSCPDGRMPEAALIQATDGMFYGTTDNGGSHYVGGTLFRITPDGVETVLYSFTGGGHIGALFQATDGNLYGTTPQTNGGSIFRLTMGLAPFVRTLPNTGKAGLKVVILGTNLTGTSAVRFNGTSAAFQVISATEITATVPIGATTGTVEVITPRGTLLSNVTFQVP
jgi:uncharacterized repeat protein (TIGR03803 family)